VASPHITPLPPILPLLGLSSGWLLHCLPLVRMVVASPLLMLPPPICRHLCLSLRRHLFSCPSPCIASCTSSMAYCCVASPHTAASHLQGPPPLLVPLTLVPLVWLVVVSPLLTPPPPICRGFHLSLRCCLLSCLSLASCLAGCCVASLHIAASYLPVPPPLIAPLSLVLALPLMPLVQLVDV
jgi:hypothetical protein